MMPAWLRQYRRQDLGDDALAGTITAILLVPQALAYAVLAGLPPQVGLYASIVPPLIYALTGSSRTLAVGPVAVAAVMVAAALANFADGDPERALAGALWLGLLSGGFLLLFGLLRLGWLSHFVSHPVLNGFSTGAAITIIGTQLPMLLGISLPNQHSMSGVVSALWSALGQGQGAVIATSTAIVVLLLLARYRLAGWLTAAGLSARTATLLARMAPLLVVVSAILLSLLTAPAGRLPVVGEIPAGVPGLSFSFLWVSGWQGLIGSALLIALVGYVESLSVARLLALRRRERIDADRELLALGGTNVGSALFGGMPVAGGFARSMVNFDAGARTQLAAIITAAWVLLSALFFTSLLAPLPKAVLAAIVVVAVTQLIDLRGILATWRYDWRDGAAQATTVAGVLVLGIEQGLLLGVALAMALFLHRTSDPHIAVIGRVPGSEHFRNVLRHDVQTWPHRLLLRIDENLYFANTPRIEHQILNRVAAQPDLRHLVLNLSGVAVIDASGLEMLETLSAALAEAGITLHLAEVKGPVMDRLQGTHWLQSLPPGRIHLSMQQAMQALDQAGPVQ